ncbi:DUF4907 domain-containing protein [Panacibacter ginsenosidivorans]|uniref:DUF4907 domain-containing protein n=1 Tax=Panacibacter ginsenosidivorans TaxID=1813871 RepID=A0A5B8VE00_9BACT|nr:DUF4907 domain-containing protein [Panacibacter ginsenosidivorans]QEC69221.1 DUF4907 domain-containing protein [Panacibacter ginsenosidivorans]
MKKNLLLITILLLVTAIKISGQNVQGSSQVNTQSKLTYKIINSPYNTYGYDVYADGKLLIHQTSIPAMQGNKGFAAKTNAARVAELVIEKLHKGIMPPTITKEELQKLKVIP